MTSVFKANSFLAVLAAGLVATWATVTAAQPSTSNLENARSAEPSQFRVGTLDDSAVAEAQTFNDYPIAWLGEEFSGYKLTRMFRALNDGQDAVYLIYGACEPPEGASEPSCVPPIEIVTSAPGTIPGDSDERLVNAGEAEAVRGAIARSLSGSLFIWTGGVVITIHSNGPFVPEALQGLRSANHAQIGFDEVRVGDGLRGFAR